jgi:hypothetical protein
MSKLSDECSSVRAQLLEISDGSGKVPETHLVKCAACRTYWETVQSAGRLLTPKPLYTPGLKRRTFRRLEEALIPKTPVLLPVFVILLATTTVISAVTPIWLLSQVLSLVFESMWIRLGLAMFLAHSMGGAAVGLWAVPLAKRAALARTSSASGGVS